MRIERLPNAWSFDAFERQVSPPIQLMSRVMNKTVIASVAIITAGVVAVSYMVVDAQKKITLKTQLETRDRFTVCVQTVMSEARQSGKPIEALEANKICEKVNY